jgi:hypothetical protein
MLVERGVTSPSCHVAGVGTTATATTWEHPFADVRADLRRRPAAWIATLRASEESFDPLLLATIPAVHRGLIAALVPHVLPLAAVEREGDRVSLVYRYEEGESLAQRLARGRIPVDARRRARADRRRAGGHGHVATTRPRVPTPPPSANACARSRTMPAAVTTGRACLRAASRSSCWCTHDDADTLRVKALMELGQFADCASAVEQLPGRGGELARMGELCRRRAAAG